MAGLVKLSLRLYYNGADDLLAEWVGELDPGEGTAIGASQASDPAVIAHVYLEEDE